MKRFRSCSHAGALAYCARVHGSGVVVSIEERTRCGKRVAGEAEPTTATQG